jgi:hypothetical protein
MPAAIITTDDLHDFKLELIAEFKKIVEQPTSRYVKKYLKSGEVMDLLQISPGTLQNMRINGTLPYSKIGGIILYETEAIEKVLNDNRVSN